MLDFSNLNPKPNITARFNLPSHARIYVYGNGFDSPFAARDHVEKTYDTLRLGLKSNFFIVLPWVNDDKSKMIDFFSYSLTKFPDNDESPTIYTKEGEIIEGGSCCLDGRLICGAEDFYRRTVKTVDEYRKVPPPIKGLKLNIDE